MKDVIKKHKKNIGIAFVLATILYLIFYIGLSMKTPNKNIKNLSYNNFIKYVEANKVKDIGFNRGIDDLTGTLKDGTSFKIPNPNSQRFDFKLYLLKNNVQVKQIPRQTIFQNILGSIIKTGSLMITLYIFLTILTKKQTSIGSLQIELKDDNKITFKNVAGCEEAKENLDDIIDFLKNPKKYKDCGCYMPKGTILYGPPGTGKTLLAKAVAGEAKASFISLSGSDFVEKFVGVGASRIRQTFKKAKKNSPCIIFIDEIDAIGQVRGQANSNSEREQTLNQLLVEMDGFDELENVVIIAATNRIDVLDKALLRAGRFDRQIEIGLPDKEARLDIINYYLKGKKIELISKNTIAHMTIGMSGADIKNIVNEACILAARNNKKTINMDYINKAINKILVGDEKKNKKSIKDIDRKITAYHEAGHTLIAKLLTDKEIPRVTIIPTTKGAGGYTLMTPLNNAFSTKKSLENEICISLGGRVAEEIIFGKENVTNGASADIQNLTRNAIRMVESYGMNENIGMVSINEFKDNYSTNFNKKIVFEEVKNLIKQKYEKTLKIMENNKFYLEKIAERLLEKETIEDKEINVILGKNQKSSLE